MAHDPQQLTPYYWSCSCGAHSDQRYGWHEEAQIKAMAHKAKRGGHQVTIGGTCGKWEGDNVARNLVAAVGDLNMGLDPGPNVPPPEPKREPETRSQ